jgi:hypothetical protein
VFKTPVPIQIGFPELLAKASVVRFQIIKHWLSHCDRHHPNCQPSTVIKLPKRLLDVGTESSPLVKLLETTGLDMARYAALSHPWGDESQRPHFCTWPSNIDAFQTRIVEKQFTPTFRDAVITTRALGLRYLWIDSLCIIQGKEGDFNTESAHMESVFASAYCIIAASRATGQWDGFLDSPKRRRDFVAIDSRAAGDRQASPKMFYVCEAVDVFNEDVILSKLNKRGWVLQERALAKRTVFFTENQVYWECGMGVRCETLARMHRYAPFRIPHFSNRINASKVPWPHSSATRTSRT